MQTVCCMEYKVQRCKETTTHTEQCSKDSDQMQETRPHYSNPEAATLASCEKQGWVQDLPTHPQVHPRKSSSILIRYAGPLYSKAST